MPSLPKDYLDAENVRNKSNHGVYEKFLRRAVGEPDANVLIVHHLTVKTKDQDPNEIPSADTMMFCHELMKAVFGAKAQEYMQRLAAVPVERRDALLAQLLEH